MSNHVSHRHDSATKKHQEPLHRGSVSATFPAQRAPGLREALRDALEELEKARQQTTHRANLSDDDEDPTRHLGAKD